MKHSNASRRRGTRSGFSLIELVIVVVIIAIIGAIAIPKMSRGAAGASDSALAGDLKVLRTALDLYASEHNSAYPTAANAVAALTQYTDDQGNVSATKTGAYVYGPYVKAVPPLPVGAKKGQAGLDLAANAATATVGWIYDPATGSVAANTTAGEQDTKGIAYNAY